MSAPKAPPPRDGWRDAVEEAEPFREATPLEHYEGLVRACRLAFQILERHPRRSEFLAFRDPLPPESERLLRELRERQSRR